MKIRFLRNYLSVLEEGRTGEYWDKSFYKGDVLECRDIIYDGPRANVILENGDVLVEVLREVIEVVGK